MKFMQPLRRFLSKAWLAAGPLILLLLLIVVPVVLAIISAIIERVFGPEASERFAIFWVDAMMWGLELLFILAPIALAVYVAFRLAKWLSRKKERL
jgi:hypothetical protein